MQILNIGLDRQARIIKKTMTLYTHENIILNSMTWTRKKGLLGLEETLLNDMKVTRYSMFLFLFFCLEATLEKKNTWMRTISIMVMVTVPKVILWNVLDISYVQSFFSTISRHNDNGIWKAPYSWRYYRHWSRYMLILFWVNIIKRKWEEAPWKLTVAQKSKPVLWKTVQMDIWFHLLLYLLFLSNKPSVGRII